MEPRIQRVQTLAQVSVPNGGAGSAMGAIKGANAVIVQAAYANTASIWVGDSDIAANNGVELGPGDAITIPCPDSAKVFVVANTSGQKAAGLVL